MSDRVGQINKTKDGKGRYSTLSLFDRYKGKPFEANKSTVVPRHGLQSLGKVAPVRRIPPPAHLPSLRSENRGNDPSVTIVPKDGTGWANKQEQPDQKSSIATPPLLESQLQHALQKSASSLQTPLTTQESTAASVPKQWAQLNGKIAEADGLRPPRRLQPFSHEEFPTLKAAGEQDKAGKERSAFDPSYGPGPSLRPQNATSWREGGGRNLHPSTESEGKSTGQSESGTPAVYPPVTAPAPTPSPSPSVPAPTVSAPSSSSTPTTTAPPDAKDPVVRPALPQRRGVVSALQHPGQQRHPTPVYHDMLPAFMCPKEPCEAPLLSECGPAAVVALVRFEARPSFKPQLPAPEPINGEVRRESRFACGPSSRPIRRPTDRATRPTIVSPTDLRDLDDLDKDCEDGWAGLHEDVDYGEKLRFSDEEEDCSLGEKSRKWVPWGKQCERQASLRSGEGPPPPWCPPAETQKGMEERDEPRRGQCASLASSEAEEQVRQRRKEGERRDVCASKLKEPDEKKEGDRDLENRPLSPNLPLSRLHLDTWQYTPKEFSELPSGQNSRQDCGDAKTLGAHYRTDDRGPTETSPLPECGNFQKSLPPRFQKQQDQLYEGAQWPQSGRPSNPPHGYCPTNMLGLDPRWRMMPPYMDPRGAQEHPLQDYYPPALQSGMMKQAISQDQAGSASDKGCHPRMHQERVTEPYLSWDQECYPTAQARSLTPLYQRPENDRNERPCSQDSHEEFGDSEDLPPQGCGQSRKPGVALESSPQKESRTEAHTPKGRASPGSPGYPQPDLKELGYGGNGMDSRVSWDQQSESADRDGDRVDLWRNQGPQKQDWGLHSQWADPSVASSIGGRSLARRTGPMRRPVLKALNVEDKENERPTPEVEDRPVPYRLLETEALANVYDLKLHSASPPLSRRGPAALAKEKSSAPLRVERSDSPTDDGPVGSCLESNKAPPKEAPPREAWANRDLPTPRRSNWIFIDEDQAFGGVKGVGRGRGRGFREFSSGGGGHGENRSRVEAQRPSRGRAPGPSEDTQKKPRRRSVSESHSETSEYEELPKRRRHRGEAGAAAGPGGATDTAALRTLDSRDSWRSNRLYSDQQGVSSEPPDRANTSRGFDRSRPPRLANMGYSRGSRDTASWRGRGTQFGGGSVQENCFSGEAEDFARRALELENGPDDREGDGEYYPDNDNPDNRPLRRRRPPHQDKPPRFRRLQPESAPAMSWAGEEHPWPENSMGGGEFGAVSESCDSSDRQEQRRMGHYGDAPLDQAHSEPGPGEKRDLAKRSFSSQRPLLDRQTRRGDPASLENGACRSEGWQNAVPPTCRRSPEVTNTGLSSGVVHSGSEREEMPPTVLLEKEPMTGAVKGEKAEPQSQYEHNGYLLEGEAGVPVPGPEELPEAFSKKQHRQQEEACRRTEQQGAMVSVKTRGVTSTMPPRFAKTQGSISLEQPEEALSCSTLGSEIWETNTVVLTVQSSSGDSWSKLVAYPGADPNSEVFKGCLTDSGIDLSTESQGSSASSSQRSSPYGTLKPSGPNPPKDLPPSIPQNKDADTIPDQSKEHKPGPIGNERSLKHRKGSERVERLQSPIAPGNGVDDAIAVPPIEFGVSAKDADFSLPIGSAHIPASNPVTKLHDALANNAIPTLRRDHLHPAMALNTLSYPSTDLSLKMESARKAWENSPCLSGQGPPGSGPQPPCGTGSSSGVSYSTFGGVSMPTMPVVSAAPSVSLPGNHIPPLYLDGHVFPSQPRLLPPTMTPPHSYQQQIPMSLHTSLQAQAQLGMRGGIRGGLPVSQTQDMFSSIPPFRSQVYMHPSLSQPSPMLLPGGTPMKGPYSAFPDMLKPQAASHYQPLGSGQPLLYDGPMGQAPGMATSQLIQVTVPLPGSQLRYGSAQQHLILPQSVQLPQAQSLPASAPRRVLPNSGQTSVITACRETAQVDMKGFQFADKSAPNPNSYMSLQNSVPNPNSYRPGSASPSGTPSGPGHYPQQGRMVMHMRPPTSSPFPSPIQRPALQVGNPVTICSPPYPGPAHQPLSYTGPIHEPPPATPRPVAPDSAPVGPEEGMQVPREVLPGERKVAMGGTSSQLQDPPPPGQIEASHSSAIKPQLIKLEQRKA